MFFRNPQKCTDASTPPAEFQSCQYCPVAASGNTIGVPGRPPPATNITPEITVPRTTRNSGHMAWGNRSLPPPPHRSQRPSQAVTTELRWAQINQTTALDICRHAPQATAPCGARACGEWHRSAAGPQIQFVYFWSSVSTPDDCIQRGCSASDTS